ncbi:MAG: CinA family protein [Dehalococcoidia bacterium]
MRGVEETRLLAEGRRLAGECGALLAGRGLTLCVVEASSGGALSSLITDVPQSSRYFLGAIVPYSYDASESLLGIAPATLDAHGAVSEEAAVAMAEAARRLMSTDYALAVSGIAGPRGGTESKPVGLTYVALAHAGDTVSERHESPGDRIENKLRSALAALELLSRTLRSGGGR